MANYSQGAGAGSAGTAGTTYTQGDWFSARAAWLQTISTSFQVAPVLKSECASTSTELELSAAQSATAGILTTKNGGVIHLSTGAGAGVTTSILRNKDGALAAPSTLVSNSRTAVWACVNRAQVVTAPVNTGYIPVCGILDGTTDIYFGCLGSNNTTNYVVGTNAGTVTTGVAIDTTAFHDFALVNDGTNLMAYVDGVQIYTIAVGTKIATTAGFMRMFVQNGATGGNQEAYYDKIAFFTAAAA